MHHIILTIKKSFSGTLQIIPGIRKWLLFLKYPVFGICDINIASTVCVIFWSQQYDEAEKAYQEVLKYDSNNEDATKELYKCHTLQLMVRSSRTVAVVSEQ